MSKLGQAVLADARKAIKERKQQQRKFFPEIYDNISKFKFPKEVNMYKHFCFPKMFGPDGLGQEMGKREIAVYPVLCSRANFERNTWFQLSQEAIAMMAGVSVDVAASAINDLAGREFEGKPLIEKKKTTERERHFYLYHVNFIRKHMIPEYKGNYFKFYTCIIDKSIWARLSPRAKCLYLAYRNHAEQNIEIYCEVEGFYYNTSSQEGYNDYYAERAWDLCTVSTAELCGYMGIEHTNIQGVFKQLEKEYLIEKFGRFVKVYLRPWYGY